MSADTSGFYALERTIENLVHIRCTQYKEDYIRRRILSRMRVAEKETFTAYHSFLLSTPTEVEELKNALTINVTKFFRDPEVFEIIRRTILPDLIQQKKRVHIWCAGCSSGEEPYSLAILLDELCQFYPDFSGVIYATDIDDEILEKAKAGIYEARSVEEISPTKIRRHFTQTGDGRYEIKPHLKKMVRFRHHDLMSGVPISRFLDFVSCRNVTIYFTESQKNELGRMFYSSLSIGGYYVMGKTEYLTRDIEHLFEPFNALEKIYRKGK